MSDTLAGDARAAALAEGTRLVDEVVGPGADAWDEAGVLPADLLRELGRRGLLCAQVPAEHGGLGLGSGAAGELTAHVGALCSSTRSVMTSQGMAAWAIQRLGDPGQRAAFLPELTGGRLAAVAMTEAGAGSDLAGIATTIDTGTDTGTAVVTGTKRWVTAAAYADHVLVFGRHASGAAAVVVPAGSRGMTVEAVPPALGCRAAGHAHVDLDGVRVPASHVLAGVGPSMALLVTTALAAGRMSVAWGSVGIVRAALRAAATFAAGREQGGAPIASHQLVARHLAELYTSERVATLACEHASRCWDDRAPDAVVAAVTAKYVAARHAAAAGATAVQVLASWGAHDAGIAARAFRDAKLMEIIEGSNETCELILAEHGLAARPSDHPERVRPA